MNWMTLPKPVRPMTLAPFLLATLILGAPDHVVGQRGSNRQAIDRIQQEVQARLQRSEGQDAWINFNNDANTQWQNNQDIRVTGSGEVWKNNRRRSFYYQGTVGNRDGNAFNVRSDWRGGWVNDSSSGGRPPWAGGGGGGGRPPWNAGSGSHVDRVQQEVQARLQRSEGQDAWVNFNNDANTQVQNNQDVRVTGSGEVWKNNRRRSFYYQGTVRNRDGNAFDVRSDWRGGWVNDNSTGGRPPWAGGGRPPWNDGSGGYVERPNGRVRYSGPITNEETGKVLDVAGWSREDGANVQQWSFAGQQNQRWDVIDVGRGEVAIVSQNSGRVLDVSGFSTSNGGNVQQYRWSGQNNQRWRIEADGSGTTRIVNVNSRKCLDVREKSRDDGANIHQWDCNGDRSQRWRLSGY